MQNRATRRQIIIQGIKDNAEKMQTSGGPDRLLRRLFSRNVKHQRNRLKRLN